MNSHQLEDNLQVIRTLMERSAMYQRAVRPILILAGSVGTVAAVAGYFLQPPFVIYWAAIAVVVLAGAFYLSRRQALKDGEKFWSSPAKRVAAAMLPMMVVGLILTLLFWKFEATFLYDVEINLLFVAVWLWIYGCALHTAGMFATGRLRILGWLCIIGGVFAMAMLMTYARSTDSARVYSVMGFFFGPVHLAFGLIPARAAAKE